MPNLFEKTYPFARPLLFRMDAERAHNFTLKSLKLLSRFSEGGVDGEPAEAAELMGLKFPNRLGLAAGLDKNGDYIDALGGLGFGFIEIGTVTPRPQPGNPKPRLFRLPESQAVINRMGFNNKGADYLVSRVKSSNYPGILGINIGKNFDTPNERAVDDYIACLKKAWDSADYIVVNISSPNTQGLRDLQGGDALAKLLDDLKNEQQQLIQKSGTKNPLLVKIAPDLQENDVDEIAEVILKKEIDGVICTNTTVSRDGVESVRFGQETGGLSGAPLTQKSTDILKNVRSKVGPDFPIIGVGGVMSAQDAVEKLEAGANLVQIYTGLIYSGPAVISEVLQAFGQQGF